MSLIQPLHVPPDSDADTDDPCAPEVRAAVERAMVGFLAMVAGLDAGQPVPLTRRAAKLTAKSPGN